MLILSINPLLGVLGAVGVLIAVGIVALVWSHHRTVEHWNLDSPVGPLEARIVGIVCWIIFVAILLGVAFWRPLVTWLFPPL